MHAFWNFSSNTRAYHQISSLSSCFQCFILFLVLLTAIYLKMALKGFPLTSIWCSLTESGIWTRIKTETECLIVRGVFLDLEYESVAVVSNKFDG